MAARQQNLYQIYKLTSTFICENNLDIKNYTKKKALQDGCLVSVGDNIAFDQIRKLKGDTRTYQEIFEDVSYYRGLLRKCKKEGRQKDAEVIAQKIRSTLFVSDIISVEAKTKTEYRKLAKAGFYVNGVRYVRFSASAGQIRHNTVLFINAEISEQITKSLMCGLDEKVKEFNMAKLSAYYALATSSVLWVSTPRVCVVKDFFTIIPKQKIDWICNADDGKKYVEEREVDVELNSADGQGLIDPQLAQKWSEEMGLDYIASSYVVRSVWVKGNLVPFDFRAYAKQHGITRIYDRWGYGHNIDEIDCLLSESQFKMYKYYSSWEEYNSIAIANGIKWGISRYNRKFDDEWVLTNYQYIQVLDIDKEDIKTLIEPTINWLSKICSGNPLYALLYTFGGFSNFGDSEDAIEYNDVYTRAQNLAMQAVVRDSNFLQDTYVQNKIYRNIIESINRTKIGKIWTRGNYQFMISDPIAQCRSALGLDPTGEIPSDCIYSNFWNQRLKGKDVILARSPCLDKHEINRCSLYHSSEADYWYQYIQTGIIYSIYDTSVCRHSDSDFDGDIVYSTDNEVFLKGCAKDYTNPIMYDKTAAPSHKINHRNFVETDIRGFGTKVGTYSNYSTVIEAMMAVFTKDEQERQRAELYTRKKLLREINGQEIDRIKGVEAKGPDKETWLKFQKIEPDDDDITKAEKYYHNSLVISKKPYFFRYLYPELNKKFKQYENSYNEISKCMFGVKFKKLLTKKDKTEKETILVKRYHKFSPLINSNCSMNLLCRELESIDFDIQYAKDNKSMLPYIEDYEIDSELLEKFRGMYRKYSNKKALTYVNYVYNGYAEEDYREMRFSIMDAIRDEIQEEFWKMNLTPMEALTYIRALSKTYGKFNWAFAWDLLQESILGCIEAQDALAPVEAENGEEYLGHKYVLRVVPKENKDKYFEMLQEEVF